MILFLKDLLAVIGNNEISPMTVSFRLLVLVDPSSPLINRHSQNLP